MNTEEFVKITLSKAYDTYKAQYDLFIKIWTLLIIADMTFIGYAIKANEPYIALIASVFPIAIYIVTKIIRRTMMPIIYVAVSIEEQIESDKFDFLASTYASILMRPKFINQIKEISRIENKQERLTELKRMSKTGYSRLSKFGFVLFLTVTTIQIIIPILIKYWC